MNKRDTKREKKRIQVSYGNAETMRTAFAEDISPVGMFIKTANVCLPNSKIRIKFSLNKDDLFIEVDACVMWAKKVPANMLHVAKKGGMGVRFLQFHTGKEIFERYFEELAAKQNS